MLSEGAECLRFLVSLWGVDGGKGLQALLQASIHPQFTDSQHFLYVSLRIDDH